MRIQVSFPTGASRFYTYGAPDGTEIQVGDFVVVPPNWMSDEPQRAIVEVIGSDYTGEVVDIIQHIPSEPKP